MSSKKPESIDQLLEKTDVGSHILKYKNLIVGVLGIAVMATIGVGVYYSLQKQARQDYLRQVYLFKEGPLKQFKDKKLDQKDFLVKVGELKTQVKDSSLFPVLLEVVYELRKSGHHQDALKVFSKETLKDLGGQNPYFYYFARTSLAVLYEENGKFNEAISLLEELSTSKTKILPAKVYLDLGRLYSKLGNKEKAKLNLNYVLSTYPTDEMAKIARIYLSGI